MPKKIAPLSDKTIKDAKTGEKDYHLYDGDGLRCRVKTSGSKHWIFNYYHPYSKKRTNMGLGSYPELSLANARKLRAEARELLVMGIDPQAERKRKKQEYDAIHVKTLEKVAADWFEIKKEEVTPDYANDIWRSLERNVFPKIGNTPIKYINAEDTIKALKPLEKKGTLETLKRVIQRLNKIMTFAMNCNLILVNPIKEIKDAFKKAKKENMPTLLPEELPELMESIAGASMRLVTRHAIEYQLHTMGRPGEVASARWDEIDFKNKLWIRPKEKMKKRQEHRVPLTEQALEILEAMKPISGHREFIFPSDRDSAKHISSQTANAALKRIGFEGRLVAHGLRSIASTILNDHGFDKDLVEVALSHVGKDPIRIAYDRGDRKHLRMPMMDWWSKYIEKSAKGEISSIYLSE